MSDPKERVNRYSLVDVAIGPMRQQKAAPKFDMMAYLLTEVPKKPFDMLNSQRDLKKTKVKSAFDAPQENDFKVQEFEEIFDFSQKRVISNDINAEELLKHESLKSFHIDLSGITPFDKQLLTSTLE